MAMSRINSMWSLPESDPINCDLRGPYPRLGFHAYVVRQNGNKFFGLLTRYSNCGALADCQDLKEYVVIFIIPKHASLGFPL